MKRSTNTGWISGAVALVLIAATARSARAEEARWLAALVFETESTSWSNGTDAATVTSRRAIGVAVTRRANGLDLALKLAFTAPELTTQASDYATPEGGVFLFPSPDAGSEAQLDLQSGLLLDVRASNAVALEDLPLSLLVFAEAGAQWAPGASASRMSAKSAELGAGVGALVEPSSAFRLWAGARAGYRVLWLDVAEEDTTTLKPSGVPIGISAGLEIGAADRGLYLALSGRFLDATRFAAALGWVF